LRCRQTADDGERFGYERSEPDGDHHLTFIDLDDSSAPGN